MSPVKLKYERTTIVPYTLTVTEKQIRSALTDHNADLPEDEQVDEDSFILEVQKKEAFKSYIDEEDLSPEEANVDGYLDYVLMNL